MCAREPAGGGFEERPPDGFTRGDQLATTRLRDATALQDVGALRHVAVPSEVLLGDQPSDPGFLGGRDRLAERADDAWSEANRGLVEEGDRRGADQCAGDGENLLLP